MINLPRLQSLARSGAVLFLLGAFLVVAKYVQAQDASPSPQPETVQNVQNVAAITEGVTPDTGSMNLTAIPPRLGDDGELRGDPGTAIQTQVRVRNELTTPVTIQTSTLDFIIGEDGKTPVPVLEATNSLWSLAQWITVVNPRNIIPANGSVTVPVIIQVPEDARPGGRFAMIMHQPVASGGVTSLPGQVAGTTGVSPQVGTLVFFRVNGPVVQDAALRNIMIPGLSEFGPVPIEFEVENLSDIHIQPRTTITIRNLLGQAVETVEVNTHNVFPYSTRPFSAEWDRVWGFGRYTAEFVTTYGDEGKVATAQYSFWLIPYTLILAGLFILLALVGVATAVRRHLQHRNSIEQQHITLLEDRIRQLENDLQHRE